MMLTSMVLGLVLAQAGSAPAAPPVTRGQTAQETKGQQALETVALQVALDRAGFSPGAIDGKMGPSTRKALEAYRRANGGDPPTVEPITGYEITEADVDGPFQPQIPSELPDQADLPALAYRNPVEALAERFHTTPRFLEELNPAVTFSAGEQIAVPDVEPLEIPAQGKTVSEPAAGEKDARGRNNRQPVGTTGAAAGKPDVVITVSKAQSALTVTDASGKVLMYAPVTTGSERDPLPIGQWKVNGITLNPPFRYNPDLFWDADASHTQALIPPGPNNPVGLVWIDLSKEHYGIHGTPEPTAIGRTQSHGCVRLTNWDAVKLAQMVRPGTRVVFKP